MNKNNQSNSALHDMKTFDQSAKNKHEGRIKLWQEHSSNFCFYEDKFVKNTKKRPNRLKKLEQIIRAFLLKVTILIIWYLAPEFVAAANL